MARPRTQGTDYQSMRRGDASGLDFTNYRTKALEELNKLERQLAVDSLETKKELIDQEFEYRKNKLTKQQQVELKSHEAFLKAKSQLVKKLSKKYGIDQTETLSLSDSDFEQALQTLSKREKKKFDRQLKEYDNFLKARAKLEEKADENSWKREMALAKREGAGTVRGGKLLDWTMWREFGQQTAGLSGRSKFGAVVDGLVSGLSDFAKKLDSTIDTITGYQSRWDTRLYGYGGSSYSSITKSVTGAASMSPFVQQSKIMQNIDSLVQQGIAYNVEQRGFLQTIAEKIATTFDAANGTLLQLVRVQQADTTAARLGLEAGVTRYLNNMYSNSEYMNGLYKQVVSNLYETSSMFSGQESIGFEYQVQKWLGSLYSVGMSESAISNISSAIGQLGSGNISALSGNSAMQNLLVMAASKGGLSYADMLTGGLSGQSVNKLMQGLVMYLADVANSGNNVVKSQYANIFGMSMSDLKAISNLSSSVADIARSNLDYSGSVNNLFSMANSMGSRISLGEKMSNLWSNVQYGMSSGIAMNPAMYALYKASGLLDTVAGGIPLSDIKYLGTGVNLQTTVADLMRVTALSGGIIGSIAQMIGAGGGGGFSGTGLLNSMGIFNTSKLTTVQRGTGMGFNDSGESVSLSNFIGNKNAASIQEGLVSEAETDASKKLIKMKEENEEETKLKDVNDTALKILSYLKEGVIAVSINSVGGEFPFTMPPGTN